MLIQWLESFGEFGLEKVEHKVFTHNDFPENDVNKLDRLDVPHLYYKYQWRNWQYSDVFSQNFDT